MYEEQYAAGRIDGWFSNVPRQTVIGAVLVVALLAFEVFNFDTTKFALTNLLGDVSFAGVGWAAILAIAFCAIDFAGLAHLFTPERGRDEPKEVWYLMGAWLLGATMNAIMTWWAVSLTLLSHDLGNEVLSREQLLRVVPVFVAVLVWLTRILFIGALSVAGERAFGHIGQERARGARRAGRRSRPAPAGNKPLRLNRIQRTSEDLPPFMDRPRAIPGAARQAPMMAAPAREEARVEPVGAPRRAAVGRPATRPRSATVREPRPARPAAVQTKGRLP